MSELAAQKSIAEMLSAQLREAREQFAKAKAWNALTELQIKNLQSIVSDQESDNAAALAQNEKMRGALEVALRASDPEEDWDEIARVIQEALAQEQQP